MEQELMWQELRKIEEEAENYLLRAKEHVDKAKKQANVEAERYTQEALAKSNALRGVLENEFIEESKRLEDALVKKIAEVREELTEVYQENKDKVLKLLAKEILD